MKNRKELDSIIRRMTARSGDSRRTKAITKLLIEEIEELYEIVEQLGYVHSHAEPPIKEGDIGEPVKATDFLSDDVEELIPENVGTPLTDIIDSMETEDDKLSEDELFDILDKKEDSEDDTETPDPDSENQT